MGLVSTKKRTPQADLIAEWQFNEQTGQTLGDSGPRRGNPLQLGSTSGVDTNDPTWDGEGLTFDGVDNYCQQSAYDTQQGILSYQGNDTTTAEFRDTGQDFSEWQTVSGNARYMLVIVNSDNSLSWGYVGAASNGLGTNDDIDIYTDIALTTRGWKGVLPVAGGKTPTTYAVRKVDFQITSAITVGCWVNAAAQSGKAIVTKYDSTGNYRSWELLTGSTSTNKMRVLLCVDGTAATRKMYESSIIALNSQWNYCTFTFDGANTLQLYVNGVLDTNPTKSADPAVNSLYDSPAPLLCGAAHAGVVPGAFYTGQIAHVFIVARAMNATEIQRLYYIERQKLIARGLSVA